MKREEQQFVPFKLVQNAVTLGVAVQLEGTKSRCTARIVDRYKERECKAAGTKRVHHTVRELWHMVTCVRAA